MSSILLGPRAKDPLAPSPIPSCATLDPTGKLVCSMYSVSVFYQLNSRTGLYTSPHMVSVRERIRINGVPLSEEDFAKYFFQVFEKLDKGGLVGDTALYRARCNQGFILQL